MNQPYESSERVAAAAAKFQNRIQGIFEHVLDYRHYEKTSQKIVSKRIVQSNFLGRSVYKGLFYLREALKQNV